MKSIFIYFNKQFAVLKEKGKRGAYEKRRKKAKKWKKARNLKEVYTMKGKNSEGIKWEVEKKINTQWCKMHS